MKRLLKVLFAWRYRRWLRRLRNRIPLPPTCEPFEHQPSPFFSEREAYLIAKAIRDEEL